MLARNSNFLSIHLYIFPSSIVLENLSSSLESFIVDVKVVIIATFDTA